MIIPPLENHRCKIKNCPGPCPSIVRSSITFSPAERGLETRLTVLYYTAFGRSRRNCWQFAPKVVHLTNGSTKAAGFIHFPATMTRGRPRRRRLPAPLRAYGTGLARAREEVNALRGGVRRIADRPSKSIPRARRGDHAGRQPEAPAAPCSLQRNGHSVSHCLALTISWLVTWDTDVTERETATGSHLGSC